MSKLKSALIRLAHAHPELRGDLLPLLAPGGSLQKTAITKDTEDFTTWAIMRDDRINPNEAEKFLEKLGLKRRDYDPNAPKQPSKRGQPLLKGERVEVKAQENSNPLNVDVCKQFDKQDGYVTDVGSDFVVVDFRGPRGGLGRFEGSNGTGKKNGLYRYTDPLENAPTRKMIEVVYISDKDKPKSKNNLRIVQEYVEEGLQKGESRSSQYYSGLPRSMGKGKDGTFFFAMMSQQRGGYRAFNPQKGQLLYIGQLNQRPGAWKGEFAALQAKAGEGEE